MRRCADRHFQRYLPYACIGTFVFTVRGSPKHRVALCRRVLLKTRLPRQRPRYSCRSASKYPYPATNAAFIFWRSPAMRQQEPATWPGDLSAFRLVWSPICFRGWVTDHDHHSTRKDGHSARQKSSRRGNIARNWIEGTLAGRARAEKPREKRIVHHHAYGTRLPVARRSWRLTGWQA